MILIVRGILFKNKESYIKKKKVNKYKNLNSKYEMDTNDRKIDNENNINII